MNTIEVLKSRGLIHQFTDEKSLGKSFEDKVTFYIGFDPTADSLHVGSLMGIMTAAHLQKLGHVPIMLVGGGTGIVGDPSGKSEDRNMLTLELLKHNEECIGKQLTHFIEIKKGVGYFLNNYDWLKDLNYLNFLRDTGRYFRVNQMLENDTYKLKMENKQGLSFIEFNYQLLQAYDFKYLFQNYNCTLQVGGSDQWANITAGTGLVRRSLEKEVFGLTIPLLTTSSGKKMGKTETGAIWLDKNKTSVFDFFQFWINTTDEDTKKFLKIYTYLDVDYINNLPFEKVEDIRFAKNLLAETVTKIVHGEEETEKAKEDSSNIFKNTDKLSIAKKHKVKIGENLIDVINKLDSTLSKSEIKRRINARVIKINNVSVTDPLFKISVEIFVDGEALLVITKTSFFSLSI